MRTKIKLPEIFLGALLAVAVFAAGMVTDSARRPQVEQKASTDAANENGTKPHERGFWDWVTHDAAGFFTLWLVIVGSGQAGLFYWQLRYMRRGMEDATISAMAAKDSALAARVANRPWISIKEVSFVDPFNSLPNGAVTALAIKVENAGRTPALRVSVWIQLVPLILGGDPNAVNIEKIEEGVIAEGRRRNGLVSTAVFPNQVTTHGRSISVTGAEIENAKIKMKDGTEVVSYMLGFCVHYSSGELLDVKYTCRLFGLSIPVIGLIAADDLNLRIQRSLLDSAS
jgi:hypothetical protein